LVELRPNRSARVAPLKRSEIRELFEAVSGIERLAAELAAVRITPGELRRLHAMQRRMERLHERGDLRGYFEVNQQIHGFVVACGGNGRSPPRMTGCWRASSGHGSLPCRHADAGTSQSSSTGLSLPHSRAAMPSRLAAPSQRTCRGRAPVVVEILRTTHAAPD
jgi:DNA-binding FadR family transcriptional regulator